MTPVLGIETAGCGKKLLRISELFSESLLSTNLRIVTLQWFSLHRGKCYPSFCFIFRYFYSSLADFSSFEYQHLKIANFDSQLVK